MSRAASCKKKQVFGDLQNEEVLLGMKLVEPAYHIVTYKKNYEQNVSALACDNFKKQSQAILSNADALLLKP